MKRLITICLCVLFAAYPALGIVEFKDGLTHNINDDFTDSIWVDYETPNMYTTINMLPGAMSGDHCLMGFENSKINMSQSGIYAVYTGLACIFDSSQVNMSGETIISRLHTFDSSQVNMSGGEISRLHIYGSSHVDISGGRLNYTEIGFNGILNISDGLIASTTEIRNSSQVNISGGTIAVPLYPMDNSTIRIFGSDFAVDGQPVGYGELTGSGTLTGTLLSGDPINQWFIIYDEARIILVPEPTTMALLGLGSLTLLRRRKK